MATATAAVSSIREPGILPAPRRARPVLWWASFGAAMAALQIYVYLSWITSSDFKAVPTGADPVPDWIQFWAWIVQSTHVALALGIIFWVVRASIRARRLSFDAKLTLGFLSIYWLDPVPNFLRTQVMFNSYYFNRGSWVEHIPGWISPNGHLLPNALLFELPCFINLTLQAWIACWLMRQLRSRWPQIGTFGLIAVAFFWTAFFIFFGEKYIMIASGWLSWNGTIPALTVWSGTQGQMPLTETVIFGACVTAMCVPRFFRDDQGRSFVERGLDTVRISGWVKETVCALAFIGFAHLAMITYNFLTVPLALYMGPTPTAYPSYMLNGICGKGTPYPCPGPGVPILLPRPDRAK